MGSFVEYVVSSDFGGGADTLVSRAARSFLKSAEKHEAEVVSTDFLEMWIVDMTLDDFSKTTRKRYFGKMSMLYRQWKQTAGDDPFDAVRELIEMDYASGFDEASANLKLIDGLLNKKRGCADDELIDVFLYLLYNAGASIDDVVSLKIGDNLPDIPQVYDLVEQVKKDAGNRTYMFGLCRNNKRITQVKRELISNLHRMLVNAGMRFENGFSRDSITAMWMAAAIQLGISFAEIRAMISRVPFGYDSFRLIKPVEITERQRTNVLNRVANFLNDKSTRWYVMKMRPGQTPDDIKTQIQITDRDIYDSMLFYYPTHKERKRNGKGKLVNSEVAYIPSLMFFKVRCDRVTSLMHHIGRLAWCYKQTNSQGSPYCTISHSEMKKFQQHVGQFTSDIKMELVTLDEPLDIGTEVRINGGDRMVGIIGIIRSVKNADGARTYTLALSDREFATWTVADVDEVFIERV